MKGNDRSPAAPGTLQEAGPLARLLPEWSVIPIIAGLFVLAFRENAGYLNVDDLNAIISDSPAEIYAQISLQDGRYLLVAALRAFKAFDIDGLLDYAVFAALYAFAFAWFCQAAVAYLTHDAGLRPESTPKNVSAGGDDRGRQTTEVPDRARTRATWTGSFAALGLDRVKHCRAPWHATGWTCDEASCSHRERPSSSSHPTQNVESAVRPSAAWVPSAR